MLRQSRLDTRPLKGYHPGRLVKKALEDVRSFFQASVHPGAFAGLCVFLAFSLWVNYTWRFETTFLGGFPRNWLTVVRYVPFYGLPLVVAFVLQARYPREGGVALGDRRLWGLLALAAFLFAFRELDWAGTLLGGEAHPYWRTLVSITFKWVVCGVPIALYWRLTREAGEPLYGFHHRGVKLRPYGQMLVAMVPLVVAASFLPDFLLSYPQAHRLLGDVPGLSSAHYALFELVYGLDFVFTEFYFRGFVLLALARLVGPQAVLPMAAFYVFIHFEKPLGEAISSFFGGIILGVAAYKTRSIYGGIIVHLGIAWMMELAAFLQKSLR